MDKTYTKREVARMLDISREAVIRLQAAKVLDFVTDGEIVGGVSESSLKAYISGTVATFDRRLRL